MVGMRSSYSLCHGALLAALVIVGVGSDLSEEHEAPSETLAVHSGHVTELSGSELHRAIRGCRGPRAIFFSGAPCADSQPCSGHAEAGAFSEFSAAAEMFAGVACFFTVTCHPAAYVCDDHGIRKPPAVVVYPRGSGAARVFSHKLVKQEIATWVARPINDADRALVLNDDNIDLFMKDISRPVKVMLFSSRKTTPVILQALSSDPDLWPYVRFGFVRHSETEILQRFKVSEVPMLILQHGTDTSAQEIYPGGDMSIEALRGWIEDQLEAGAVDPEEDGMFRALEGTRLLDQDLLLEFEDETEEASSESSTKPGKPGSSRKPGKPGSSRKPGQSRSPVPASPTKGSRKPSGRYRMLKPGAEGCPEGYEIETLKECFQAVADLGLRADPPWVATYPGLPRYCSIRDRPSKGSEERLHFNSASEGQGRADVAPICKVSRAGPGKTSEVSETEAQEPVPELTAKSKDALLGGDGFSLIYLREGKITVEEVAMLVDLENQFRPQLNHQGTRMTWMWMDLHVERKFKAFFDPPALPSAVVLNPHTRPRFAMVQHSEDGEGDPMPTNQEAIGLLLNTVLGGDAQFSPLPAKALTKFVDL